MARLILFLLINFGALWIGGIIMGDPQTNEWYQALNKAPWTPPGWVFGAAWTTIMLCFSIFLWQASKLFTVRDFSPFYILYGLQVILNVIWNPVFFRWHMMGLGLVIIALLTLLIAWFTYWGFKNLKAWGLLMLPYIIWMCIATSLNAYAYMNN